MPPTDNPELQLPLLPALWGYINRVYLAMQAVATQAPINPGAEEEEMGLIYEGHLTQLFRELEIPNPYYTSATRTLREMGCIVQLRRGGGPAMSRWLLKGAPREDVFRGARVDNRATTLKHRGRTAVAEQRIRDMARQLAEMNARLSKLELWMENHNHGA